MGADFADKIKKNKIREIRVYPRLIFYGKVAKISFSEEK
jgi:hypothetical protein